MISSGGGFSEKTIPIQSMDRLAAEHVPAPFVRIRSDEFSRAARHDIRPNRREGAGGDGCSRRN